jgi:hypothetical protein
MVYAIIFIISEGGKEEIFRMSIACAVILH